MQVLNFNAGPPPDFPSQVELVTGAPGTPAGTWSLRSPTNAWGFPEAIAARPDFIVTWLHRHGYVETSPGMFIKGQGKVHYRLLARWKEFANQPGELRMVGEYDTAEALHKAQAEYSRENEAEIGLGLRGYTIYRFFEK
jgi:hypothetical protein